MNEITAFIDDVFKEASTELMSHFGQNLNISFKPDTSLVTQADLASEKVILNRIRKAYPKDLIYSEESGVSSKLREPGAYVWIVDPLDGTTNFANNYPFFCISIGRCRFRADGSIEPVSGGIYDPNRKKSYLASKGEGCTVNGKPIKIAANRELNKSFLVTGFYYKQGQQLQTEIDRFSRVAGVCQSIRRDGAAALDLAMVAEGVYDAFWESGLAVWDLAAGVVLVQEAGGIVTNYTNAKGQIYDLEALGVVAGNQSAVEGIGKLLQ